MDNRRETMDNRREGGCGCLSLIMVLLVAALAYGMPAQDAAWFSLKWTTVFFLGWVPGAMLLGFVFLGVFYFYTWATEPGWRSVVEDDGPEGGT